MRNNSKFHNKCNIYHNALCNLKYKDCMKRKGYDLKEEALEFKKLESRALSGLFSKGSQDRIKLGTHDWGAL